MAEEKNTYLEQLNKAYIESSSQFDKQILFIASGALGVSLAFIKDIVKLDIATNKNLLLLSWIFFGAVILICILSHYTSLKAINFKIENLYQKCICLSLWMFTAGTSSDGVFPTPWKPAGLLKQYCKLSINMDHLRLSTLTREASLPHKSTLIVLKALKHVKYQWMEKVVLLTMFLWNDSFEPSNTRNCT